MSLDMVMLADEYEAQSSKNFIHEFGPGFLQYSTSSTGLLYIGLKFTGMGSRLM